MAIAEMKKILLFAHRAEKDVVIRALQSLGLVEIRSIQDSSAWEEWGQYLAPEGDPQEVARLETRLGEVKYALDFLQRHFPVKKSFVQQFAGGKLALPATQYAAYTREEDRIQEIYQACRRADERVTALRNEETRTRNLLTDLEPYRELDLPLAQLGDSRWVSLRMGSLPGGEWETFRGRLAETEAFFQVCGQDREQAYVLLVYLRKDPVVEEALKEGGFTPVSVPAHLQETPAQCIAALEEELERARREREHILRDVAELVGERPRLMAYYDHLALERDRYAVTGSLAGSAQMVLLTGWARAADVPYLEAELSRVSRTALLVAQDPEAGETYPVDLQNPALVRPFEAVTKLYSNPNQKELDPTPFLAPFFFVFFGIALGDAGYGILLSLMSLLLLKKMKLAGIGERLVKLLFLGGFATLGFGILSGGWFGDLLPLRPLWFNPIDDPMRMLILSFILGIIQIYAGMALQAYRSIKAGKVLDALFDQGLWYLLLTGLIFMALPGLQTSGSYMAVAGVVGLVLTQGRTQKNPVMKFLSGLLSLYNVTGYLSDVLSYSRLLALGLASGVIAVAINTMGRLVGDAGVIGLPFMVILLLVGHAFNLIISTLGAYVHTSRLQYIEYFGKFFEGGGKAFIPFAVKTQYVDVEEREA